MTRDLTPKQARVLAVITSTIARTGRPPTVRDIAEAVGVRSAYAVTCILWSLQRNGYIERDNNKARAIRVIDREAVCRVDKDQAVAVRGCDRRGGQCLAVFMPVVRAGETERRAA
jgi:repressor LexA